MSRKRSKIVKELDPNEVEGFTQARIEHYLRLGYKPYLDKHAEVKWLTDASRNMRDAKTRRPSLRSIILTHYSLKKRRRVMRKAGPLAFIRAFWPFLLILAVIIFVLGWLLINAHVMY